MIVDMSPDAVSTRLYAMGDLWELSVALMDAIILPHETGAKMIFEDTTETEKLPGQEKGTPQPNNLKGK